jgi:dienelactone hydrolase
LFWGWIANMMAVKIRFGAAVPYYGGQPTVKNEQIKTPIMAHAV